MKPLRSFLWPRRTIFYRAGACLPPLAITARPTIPQSRRNRSILLVAIFWVALCGLIPEIFFATPASAQSDQDAIFNQAVQAYQQNQFKAALEKLQQVSGPHAQDAQQYTNKIKTYLEAYSAATTVLQRSPDERDARSLAYAIEELQVAISIKPDGPGHPEQQLQKARQLKDEIEKGQAHGGNDGDRGLCDKALAAANEHHYKEASDLSCMLANDNPSFTCGGNDAVYICQLNKELAKIDKSGATLSTAAPSSPNNAIPKSSNSTPAPHSADLDQAKAAYDHNDFERARALFQKMPGDSAVAEFLDEISRYTDSAANGEKLSREGKYEEARAAFLSAADIKPDGPGNPQNRATTMELFLGLDQFYSGNYVSATQHLEDCAKTNTGKQALIHFYLGASKLSRFFMTGGEDSALHQDALNDLKLAKQEGFKSIGQDVSPKIVQVYKDLTF